MQGRLSQDGHKQRIKCLLHALVHNAAREQEAGTVMPGVEQCSDKMEGVCDTLDLLVDRSQQGHSLLLKIYAIDTSLPNADSQPLPSEDAGAVVAHCRAN